MFDTAQRLSVVLEYHDDSEDWVAVAMLIDERGRRHRATLARFAKREEAAALLERIFAALPDFLKRG